MDSPFISVDLSRSTSKRDPELEDHPEDTVTPAVPRPQSANGRTARKPAVFLQDACYQHRFIRSRDTSAIFERPERLRAVKLGLAGAIARLDEIGPVGSPSPPGESGATATTDPGEDLAAALDRMNLTASSPQSSLVAVIHSSASVDILDNPAVKFIHGDIDRDIYLENLKTWAQASVRKITEGGSEIPQGLNQGDLYLCPESIDAIQGAIGTVCEAVDTVVRSTRVLQPPFELEAAASVDTTGQDVIADRAFVAIRPPGHHCGEDTPSGFCFVNNVAVGAAHAHLKHGINRVVIFDIDLHHGNGTQSIVWQINEETYRLKLESEFSASEGAPSLKPGLQLYYGSIHDILSYPCEDGKVDIVQAASVSLHGPHGQHIENIHLHPYTSEQHFWEVLYKEKYTTLLKKAEEFLDTTGGAGDDVLVFISCGFDACEHEYPSMSRHGRKVPTSFYHRFARDASGLAERYASGRLVSVLEGGYSDRALVGGAMAHLSGLASESEEVDEGWWAVDNLVKLEKALKKRRGQRQSLSVANEAWLDRALSIFSSLDANSAQYLTPSSSRSALPVPPSSMTLRERKKPASSVETSPNAERNGMVKGKRADNSKKNKTRDDEEVPIKVVGLVGAEEPSSSAREISSAGKSEEVPRKLPRVILRVGPQPGTSSS